MPGGWEAETIVAGDGTNSEGSTQWAKLEKSSANPPPGQIKHDSHSIGTLDSSSYDDHGTATTADDEMFFGDGNLRPITTSPLTTRATSNWA